MRPSFPCILIASLLLAAAPASADWYKSYNDGLKAASAENWSLVVEKMTEAMKEKPQEDARARPSGTIFVKYHPYYYRGIANFHLGNFEEAIRDLDRAKGVGSVSLGSIDGFQSRAQTQLAQQRPSTPTTTQVAERPTPTVPTQTAAPTTTQAAAPAGDPNLGPTRSRAREALTEARAKLREAQGANAGSIAEFRQAQSLLNDAEKRAGEADTANDWSAVANAAERASITFERAISKAQVAVVRPTPSGPSTAATEEALAQLRREIRSGVQAYFTGDFSKSVSVFDRLAKKERDNPLLWAFLGASHFYTWYLNGQTDEVQKQAAIDAFRNAKRDNLRLNERYFPRRVRNFYETVR